MAQVLVFDAGSSGTRVHIFNMYPPAEGAHVPEIDLSVREKQTLKVKPGLSTFATKGDYSGARLNIEKLMDFANQFVPQERRATTPIMLKATAGLRAVPKEQAEAVLTKLREGFAESGYRFRPDWADIILGKEEGGLAWVAANYLEGTFQEADEGEKQPLGVIEMGGGSTQVTFEVPNNTALEPGDDFSFVTARGRQYRLYAHSYLGFGQDCAQQQLLRETSASEVQEDPCYPEGYTRRAASSTLIKGSGQLRSCKTKIQERVLKAAATAPGAYAKELPIRGAFVLTENFFYVQHDHSLKLEEQKRLEVADLESAGDQVCGKALQATADEIAQMESGQADAGSPKHCFGLAYQAALLQTLLASALPGVSVRIAHQVHGSDVDWAIGAALVHYLEGNTMASSEDSLLLPGLVLLLCGPPLLGIGALLWRTFRNPALRRSISFKKGPGQVLNFRAKAGPHE